MSTHRPRLSRRDAERMLDDPRAGNDEPLSAVLAAASAPAESGELSGEGQVLEEFRAVGALAPTPVAAAGLVARVRRFATAPAATLTAVGLVVAGGGLALAASQGALHVPFDGHDNRSDRAPSAPASTNPGLSGTPGSPGSTSAGPSASATSAGATPSAGRTPSASPSPSLEGLCRAFQAGATHDGKDNPAFAALYAAAGGEENVATFCADLIGPPTKPTQPVKPTQAASPTKKPKPTQAASPTKKPKPTQAADPTKPAKPTKAP